MFGSHKKRIRFNQYNRILGEQLNPISALSIVTVAHVDSKMDGYKADSTNSLFVTSIDTIAFLSFLSNLMISQSTLTLDKRKWFSKYYLDYLSKLGAFIFSLPISYTADCILNRLIYLEDLYITSGSLAELVNEYANLLHHDAIRRHYTPAESGSEFSLSAIEHMQYHIAASSLLPFFKAAIAPSIPDVIKFLQSV